MLVSCSVVLLAFMPYLIDALSNRGYPEGYELPLMAIMLAIGVLFIHLLGNRNMRSSRTPHILVLIGGIFMVSPWSKDSGFHCSCFGDWGSALVVDREEMPDFMKKELKSCVGAEVM